MQKWCDGILAKDTVAIGWSTWYLSRVAFEEWIQLFDRLQEGQQPIMVAKLICKAVGGEGIISPVQVMAYMNASQKRTYQTIEDMSL